VTFAEFIAKHGPKRLADRIERPIGTIYSWSSDNKIPRLVWPQIMLGFPEIGLHELMAMEAASKDEKRA